MSPAQAQFGHEDSAEYAVCYRCRFSGLATGATRCPRCAFPLILQAAEELEENTAVVRLFDRTAVGEEAPPLPGVDGRPRKAQLLAEERRRRRTTEISGARPLPVRVPLPAPAPDPDPAPVAAPRVGRSPRTSTVQIGRQRGRATGAEAVLASIQAKRPRAETEIPSLRPAASRFLGYGVGLMVLASAVAAGVVAFMQSGL
jgi:hypothetical protein